MRQTTTGQGKRVTGVMTADMLELSIYHRTGFSGVNYRGGPTPGIGDLDFGILPEHYRASAATAVYAVWSYKTPIGWELPEGGGWVVPGEKYSPTTNKQRKALLDALKTLGRSVSDGL